MFYLNSNLITDSAKNVIGYIIEDRFTQDEGWASHRIGKSLPHVSPTYNNGLSSRELEMISELIQRSYCGKKTRR